MIIPLIVVLEPCSSPHYTFYPQLLPLFMCPPVVALTTMALFPEQTASKISSALMLRFPRFMFATGLGEACLRVPRERCGRCTESSGEEELGLQMGLVNTLNAALRLSLLGGFNKQR